MSTADPDNILQRKQRFIESHDAEIVDMLRELGILWAGEIKPRGDRDIDKKRFVLKTVSGGWFIIFWYGLAAPSSYFDGYFYDRCVRGQHAEISITVSEATEPVFVLSFSSAAKAIPRALVEKGCFDSFDSLRLALYNSWPTLVFRDKS